MSIPWNRLWNVAFWTLSACWKGPSKVTRIPSLQLIVPPAGVVLASFSNTQLAVKLNVTLDELDAAVVDIKLTWLLLVVDCRSWKVLPVTLKVAVWAVALSYRTC